MIISRTPLRISFCGGGSDLASYYQNKPGAVVSTTINKYIYITVNKKFDDLIRASYSITEFAQRPEDLKHELIRESLLMLKIKKGIEITSISDIPSKGTGLGSSSSYTVGLLNSLHAFKGEFASPEKLASEACCIEIQKCKKPIGRQDQYAAAFGNFNFIRFDTNGQVYVDPIIMRVKSKKKLEENLLMLYTGITRSAGSILKEQDQKTKKGPDNLIILEKMVNLARELKISLEKGNLSDFGELLNENWALKKKLAKGITNEKINQWYSTGREKGAIGGKILGAGGGGFLLFYAPKEKHRKICSALKELKPISFSFEPEGSKIIYFGEK